jgi:pyroglutamyl-peptidase
MVARSLEGRMISGRPVSVRVFPVETRNIRERMEQALLQEEPDIVICMSQMGGRTSLTLERVAVNVLDFETADNVGVMRKSDPIVRGGPEARISNLPFDRIIEALHAGGVPAYVSNSAGTFVGNQLLYETLALTDQASMPVLAGLVHLPYLPAQAIAASSEANPSMSLDMMKKGMDILVETIVPWVEQRTPEARKSQEKGRAVWIPRGVKEVER